MMFILLNAVYRFNAVTIKIPTTFSLEIEKIKHPKIYMEPEKFWIIKIFSKKKNIGEIAKMNLKIHYNATVIKKSGAGTETDVNSNGIK